jgi:hypothetical protein
VALSGSFDGDATSAVGGLLMASDIAIVRTGLLLAWLGWIAIVIAVVGLTPVGFFAFLAAGCWALGREHPRLHTQQRTARRGSWRHRIPRCQRSHLIHSCAYFTILKCSVLVGECLPDAVAVTRRV